MIEQSTTVSTKNRSWLFSYLSLFTSLSTLLCCALPSLLVLFGLGASVASFLSFHALPCFTLSPQVLGLRHLRYTHSVKFYADLRNRLAFKKRRRNLRGGRSLVRSCHPIQQNCRLDFGRHLSDRIFHRIYVGPDPVANGSLLGNLRRNSGTHGTISEQSERDNRLSQKHRPGTVRTPSCPLFPYS